MCALVSDTPTPSAHDPNTYTKYRPTDAGCTRSCPQRALLRGGPRAATLLWELTKSGRLVCPAPGSPSLLRGEVPGPGQADFQEGLDFPANFPHSLSEE